MGTLSEPNDARNKLRVPAGELVELSETYEPSPPGSWGAENLLVTKANTFIAEAQTPIDYLSSLCCSTVETACVQTLLELSVIQSISPSGSSTYATAEYMDLSSSWSLVVTFLVVVARSPIIEFIASSSYSDKDSHRHDSCKGLAWNQEKCRLSFRTPLRLPSISRPAVKVLATSSLIECCVFHTEDFSSAMRRSFGHLHFRVCYTSGTTLRWEYLSVRAAQCPFSCSRDADSCSRTACGQYGVGNSRQRRAASRGWWDACGPHRT